MRRRSCSNDGGAAWDVECVVEGGHVTVQLAGVLDAGAAAGIDIASMFPAAMTELSIDLERVTFIDHAGVALVLGLRARAAELGARTDEITSWPAHNPLFGPRDAPG